MKFGLQSCECHLPIIGEGHERWPRRLILYFALMDSYGSVPQRNAVLPLRTKANSNFGLSCWSRTSVFMFEYYSDSSGSTSSDS